MIDAQSLAGQLAERGYRRTEDLGGASPARTATRGDFRWEWFATYLRLIVLVRDIPTGDRADVEQFAAQSLALAKKRCRFRGLQAGVAAVPVLLCREVDPSAAAAACAVPTRRFAAMVWPVVVDLGRGRIYHYSGDLVIGVVYQEWILSQVEVVRDLVEQAVGHGLVAPHAEHRSSTRSAPGRTLARTAAVAMIMGAGLVLVSLVILFVLNR